jgi:hypothetical protein
VFIKAQKQHSSILPLDKNPKAPKLKDEANN